MNTERLLENLINADKVVTTEQPEEENRRLIISVKQHLIRILNTRRGSVLIDKEFGISDFSDLPGNFVSPKTIEIQTLIRDALQKYEPRINDVKVIFEGPSDDKLSISFKLSGIIKQNKDRIPIVFRASMTPDKKFIIKH